MNKVKSITLKLDINNEDKDTLDKKYERHFLATQFLFNEIVCYSGENYEIRDDNGEFIEVDAQKQLWGIYEKTNKFYTFDTFCEVIKVVDWAFRCVSARSFMPLIFSPRYDAELSEAGLTEDDILNHIRFLKSREGAKKNTLNKVDSLPLEVFLDKIGFYNRTDLLSGFNNSERYSILYNIKTQFTSWVEVDKSTSENYIAERTEIALGLGKIPENEKALIIKFRDFCFKGDIVKHFSRSVKSYLDDCLIPALREGIEPKKHFRLDKKGRERRFSLHDSLFEFLRNNKELWQDEQPIVTKHLKLLELIFLHNRHRPRAAYPMIKGGQYNRAEYKLGYNYISYRMDYGGGDEETTDSELSYISFGKEKIQKVINGRRNPRIDLVIGGPRDTPINVGTILYKERYYNGRFNPSNYLNELKIWEVDKECAKEAYMLSFIKRGERFRTIVREPSIVRLSGSYFIKLPFTIIHNKEDRKWFYLGMHKSSGLSNTGTDNIVQTLEDLDGERVRSMGIDLGVSNPFAYTIFEEEIGKENSYRIIDSGLYEQDKSISSEYYNFKNDYAVASKIINRYTRDEPLEDDELEFLKRVLDYCHSSNLGPRKKKLLEQYNDPQEGFAKQAKLANGKVSIAKKSFGSVPGILYYYIAAQFKRIKNDRKYSLRHNPNHSDKISGDYHWIECCEYMKRFARKVSYIGEGNDRESIITKNVNKLREGVKRNLLRQIAARVAKIAIENNCKFISVEKIFADGKSDNTRRKNYLEAMWSPKMVIDAIENAVSWHNIMLVEVSPSGTSQVHYETKNIGYRDGRDLYVKVNKDIIVVDSDINASKMIGERAITRHGNLNQIRMTKDGESGAWRDGFLRAKFGNMIAANKFFRENNLDKENYVWYIGGAYRTESEKSEMVENIKIEVQEVR